VVRFFHNKRQWKAVKKNKEIANGRAGPMNRGSEPFSMREHGIGKKNIFQADFLFSVHSNFQKWVKDVYSSIEIFTGKINYVRREAIQKKI